jgi:hypothetical protein
MLQPDKLKKLNENAARMAEAGKSKEEILAMKDAFIKQFGETEVEKKNPVVTSPSTTTSQNSVSEPQSGSSVSQKQFENKPVRDERGREVYRKDELGNLVPVTEKVEKGVASSTEYREAQKQDLKKRAEKPIKPSVNLKKYQQSTALKPEEIQLINQEIDDELNQKGFVNGLTTGVKKSINAVSNFLTTIGTLGTETEGINLETIPFAKEQKQAEQELLKQYKGDKSKINDAVLKAKTKEIVLQNRIEGLKIDKNKQFLESLSDQDKRALELERIQNFKTINDRDKYYATEAVLLENEAEKLSKEYAVTKAILENNRKQAKETPQVFIDYAIDLENRIKNSISSAENLETKIASNEKELGSAEEEIDFLKRNYSTKDKFVNNIKLGFGDLYRNIANLPTVISEIDDVLFEPFRVGSQKGIMSEEEKQEFIDNTIDWNVAKEATRSKFSKDVTFENLNTSNFGEFFFQEAGTQVPIFAQIALPGGATSMFLTSTSDKFSQMEMEPKQFSFTANGKQYFGYEKSDGTVLADNGQEFSKSDIQINSLRKGEYTPSQLLATSFGFGAAEYVFGTMPTKGILNRSYKALEKAGKSQLIKESGLQYVKKEIADIVDSALLESVSEGLTTFTQNIIEGKENPFENVGHSAFSGGMMGAGMRAVPTFAGIMMRPFSENKQSKQIQSNLQAIFDLQDQLNAEGITDASRKLIGNKIKEFEKANNKIIKSLIGKTENISEEVYNAIVDVNKKQNILKIQANEIKNDSSLNKDIKARLIADLQAQFLKLEDKREKLVSKDVNILDALSDKEVLRLKNQASRELTKEAKDSGKETFEFDDDQITKKAIELYEESKPKEIIESQPETQLQAEKQTEISKINVLEDENVPDEVKQDIKENLERWEGPLERAKKELARLKSKNILFRDKKLIKEYEEDIKVYEDRLDKLKNNPIEYYKKELERVKEMHESRLKDYTTYKEDYLDRFGTTDFEVGHSDFIKYTNDAISKLEEANKKQAKVAEAKPKQPDAQSSNALVDVESTTKALDKLNIIEVNTKLYPNSLGYNTSETISKDYHKAKADGSNPELVKAVEELLSKNETTPEPNIAPDENIQSGVGEVGEMGIEQKTATEVIEEDNLQPTNESETVEPKQKELTEQQKKNNRIVDLKNEFNKLNNRDKNGKKGSDLRQRITQLASDLGYNVGTESGKITVKRTDGKNVGKVSFKEEIQEANQSDVDFVKTQIEQGALLWNGDPFSPRINLGISRSDITKGVEDIQAGKTNTVPAKRLIQAMAEQRKKGVYEFIQGSGGNVVRSEIPIVEDLNPQEQQVADVLETYHTDEEIQQYFNELEQLNQEENAKTEPTTEKIDDTSNSKTIIEKSDVEGKNNVEEKQTIESQLPNVNKKGSESTIQIAENVEARVTVVEFLDGENGYSVEIYRDGELVEDKNGDTEVEFNSDEIAEISKYIEDKRKGYSLAGKGKKSNEQQVKESKTANRRVEFSVFGEKLYGFELENGTFIDDSGKKYPATMIDKGSVSEINKADQNYRDFSEVKAKEKSKLDAFINKLDQLDKDLGKFGNDNLSMGLPIVISRGAIKAMKVAAQTAKTLDEVIKAGIDYIQNTDWYKNLSEKRKASINEKMLENLISSGVQTSIEADNKIQELRDKIKDGKISQKQLKDEIIQFVSSFSKKGYFTPTQSNALIKKALEVLTKRDATKAFNDFMDYYEKVIKQAEIRENSNLREQMKYEDIKSKVLDMMSQGMSLRQILSATEIDANGNTVDVFNFNEKKDAEDIFIREQDKTITNEEALEKVKKSNKELYDMLSNAGKKGEAFWNKVKDLRTLFFDRQSKIKSAIAKASFEKFKSSRIDKATERIIATNGASSYAESLFNSALEKIYNKGLDIKIKGGVAVKYNTLTSEMIRRLDEIIALRRIIAIDKSREARGLKPVKHPNNGNAVLSEKALAQMEIELGKEVFADLNERADIYFDEFRKILDMMVDSGLISKETRDDLESIDYSPRKFVKFMVDGETGELSEQAKQFNRNSAGLSGDQIQSLDEGDVTPLINNSRWLLGVAFVSRARAIFQNDTNKKIIGEFKKLEAEYETLKNKPNKTKAELNKIKEFEQLNKTIIDNPIVGYTKNGNPTYKYDSGKSGYTKAYYYIDGVQYQFLLENKAFDSLYGNVKQTIELSLLGKVFSAPSTLVKALATGRNPMFLLVNIPRDFIFTQLISQEYSNIIPYSTIQLNRDLAKGITAIATKNDLFQNYLKYGGGMSFLSTQGVLLGENKLPDYFQNENAKKIIRVFTGNRSKKAMSQLLDTITVHELNYYSELMFRLAVFDRAIKNRLKELKVKSIEDLDVETQEDVYYSAVASARSILDFNQGGSLTKAMEPYLPYINASTQGVKSLSDTLRQAPLETTVRMTQLATIPSLSVLGFSLALIAAFKDDDEEKSVIDIYLDNRDLMSKHHKKSTYTIDLGIKNEKGMPRYLKVAKEHQMMPFTLVSEHVLDNYLRRQLGRKEVDDSVLLQNFKDAFFGSAIPIDVRDPKDFISKNPLIRGILTYDLGYDFYRDEYLSSDINKNGIPKSSIGFNLDRVEDFYKVVGEQLEASPLLLKAGVESIITSPETNPHIGMIYGGLDVAVANKEVKNRMSLAGEKIWKNMGKRLFGEGSEYNKTRVVFEQLEKEFEKINLETIKFNSKINDIVDSVLDGEKTVEEGKRMIFENFKNNPERYESGMKRIENRVIDKNLDPFFRNMKYVPASNSEDKAKMQALMLYTQYGNIVDRDINQKREIQKNLEETLSETEIDRLIESYIKLIEVKQREGN